MAFSRFFGKNRDAAPAPAEDAEVESLQAEQEGPDVGDSAPEDAVQATWFDRAAKVLPTGASTGSKRAETLYGEHVSDLPTHFQSARGALVIDTNGFEYIDCTMALGAVALGYAEPRVTQAVIDAASRGNVSGLSSWLEVDLAERLCELVPCAERVQFLKSGAEAVSAAVRLARTYTAREQVIACGYFGWHDWCSDAAGVPSATRKIVDWIPFDEIGALDLAVAAAASSLAAIVIEPVVNRAPSVEWLKKARELADKVGAVLIFDEIKTGFRVAPGGYQSVCEVTPDLATFGKAMANGYPLAAVVGRQSIMDVARETWISSTLASEATALAAAIAVCDWHEEADICASLAETGREMKAAVNRAITASGLTGVTTDGVDQMWSLVWQDKVKENHFIAESMRNGVLFKRGAYNFAAIAHDERVLQDIEAAASAACVALNHG